MQERLFQDHLKQLNEKGSHCVIIFTDDPDTVRPEFERLFGRKVFQDCSQPDMWNWPRMMFHGDRHYVERYRSSISTDRPACQQVGLRTQQMEAFQLDLLIMGYCNKFIGTTSSTVTYLVRWVRHCVLGITDHPQEVTLFGPPGEHGQFWKADPNNEARTEISNLMWNNCDHVVNMLQWKMNHAQLKLLRNLPDGLINFIAQHLDAKLMRNNGSPVKLTQAVEDIMHKNKTWKQLYQNCKDGYNQVRPLLHSSMGWFKALVLFRINPYRASLKPYAALFDVSNNGANLIWKMDNVHNVLPGRKAGTGGPEQESLQPLNSPVPWEAPSSNKRPAPVMAATSKSRPPTPPAKKQRT